MTHKLMQASSTADFSDSDSEDDRIQPGMNAAAAIKMFSQTEPEKRNKPVSAASKKKRLTGFYDDAQISGLGGQVRPETAFPGKMKPINPEKRASGASGSGKRASGASSASRASKGSKASKATSASMGYYDEGEYEGF